MPASLQGALLLAPGVLDVSYLPHLLAQLLTLIVDIKGKVD